MSRFTVGPLLLARRIPDGTAGVRDVDAPCSGFTPGEPLGSECRTDGHYLCRECVRAPVDDPFNVAESMRYDADAGWTDNP